MAEKRADLEKNLEKLGKARDRILEQIEATELRIKHLQVVVNGELMENETSNSLQELSQNREKLTALQQALQYANGQVNEARQKLLDFDRATRGGIIIDLDKKVQQAVVQLQAKIGEKGLKADVDKLGEMIAELEQLSNSDIKVHDAAEHMNSARNVHDRLSRSLLATWQDIEGLGWGPSHSPTSSRPNYIPGFGVRPGNLTSA
jgi:DNA repair exonuclease SbcCD ATPase subunit